MRDLAGEKATLVWDGLPARRSSKMLAWLRPSGSGSSSSSARLRARPQPLERLWANLKGIELASLTSKHFGEITSAAHAGINRSRRIPRLLSSFLTPPDSEHATRPDL